MDRDIRYDQRYQTLLCVRSTGNYTTAGQILGLTPSAVAQQIHSVEREICATLFDKKGNQLVPTRECELVCAYAQQIDRLCERMDSDLSSVKKRVSHISIGMTGSIESSALSRMLTSYEKTPEHLQITLKTGTAQELAEQLLCGAIDFAIADSNLPGDAFNSVLLDTDHLSVIVPPDSPYVKKGVVMLNEIRSERLILRPVGSGTRDLFDATLRKMGKSISEFNVMMEVDSVSTIKNLVMGGHGVSILSSKACEREAKAGTLSVLPLCNMEMVRNIRIYYRREAYSDDLLRKIQMAYVCSDCSG